MPIAPMTLPSASRKAEAFRLVGMISPDALRGLRRALRVAPRSMTSRKAAVRLGIMGICRSGYRSGRHIFIRHEKPPIHDAAYGYSFTKVYQPAFVNDKDVGE